MFFLHDDFQHISLFLSYYGRGKPKISKESRPPPLQLLSWAAAARVAALFLSGRQSKIPKDQTEKSKWQAVPIGNR